MRLQEREINLSFYRICSRIFLVPGSNLTPVITTKHSYYRYWFLSAMHAAYIVPMNMMRFMVNWWNRLFSLVDYKSKH